MNPGSQKNVLAVVGARPNFVKMAPVLAGLADEGIPVRLLHTGQHYDSALSDSFISLLGIQQPDANLGIGSASHGKQTAAVLTGIEDDLIAHPADAIVVAGDVNSTMAAALAATKLGVGVVHLESGLRSGDWTMPEEVNRVVTDRISDLLLCTSPDAVENLAAEGISGDGVQFVGNTMIDSLLKIVDSVDHSEVLDSVGLERHGFVLTTLHRPALVDDADALGKVIEVLGGLAKRIPVLFPAHPRTTAQMELSGLELPEGVRMLDPMPYDRFVALEAEARLIVTDSGGVQEETSVLGVPCLTYRTTTERPITCELGTNKLLGVDPAALEQALAEELDREPPSAPPVIPLWDGKAGGRAAAAIASWLG